MNMRPDKQIAGLEDVVDDKNKAIGNMHIEIKELRDEVLHLRNGLRMLLVSDSWEEQPGPVLIEYVNLLLVGHKRELTPFDAGFEDDPDDLAQDRKDGLI